LFTECERVISTLVPFLTGGDGMSEGGEQGQHAIWAEGELPPRAGEAKGSEPAPKPPAIAPQALRGRNKTTKPTESVIQGFSPKLFRPFRAQFGARGIWHPRCAAKVPGRAPPQGREQSINRGCRNSNPPRRVDRLRIFRWTPQGLALECGPAFGSLLSRSTMHLSTASGGISP